MQLAAAVGLRGPCRAVPKCRLGSHARPLGLPPAPLPHRRLRVAVTVKASYGKSEGGEGRQPLDVDESLLASLRPLLRAVCHEMGAHMESCQCKDAGNTHRLAAATLAAAEANGAVPPLTARQREALRGALAQAASALKSGQSMDEWDTASAQEGHSDEELSLVIPPLARQLYDTLVNVRLHPSPEDVQASPNDSVRTGGEVGNIKLQWATGQTFREAPKGLPAQDSGDRAEREAELDFERIELGDPEGSGGQFREPAPPKRTAQQAQQAPPDALHRSLVMDDSDAPAAGDGMQAMGDAEGGDVWRSVREHYERHEPPTEGG